MNIKGDPIDIASLDLEKITLRPPEKNKWGVKSFLNYNRGPTRIVLPALRTPFGAKIGAAEYGSKIEINLAFDDIENNPETRAAFEKLEAVDERIKQQVREHLAAFFPKLNNISPDEVDKRYKSIIQRDAGYPPRIKLYIESDLENPERLLSMIGKPLLKGYDGSEIPVTRSTIPSIIPSNSIIRSVIEVAHVFASPGRGEVSVKWRLSHAKFNSPPANEKAWDFDDGDEVGTFYNHSSAPPANPPTSPVQYGDHDDPVDPDDLDGLDGHDSGYDE